MDVRRASALAVLVAFVSSALCVLGIQPAAAADYRSTVLADNPIAYWRLGEASGIAAADEVASGPTASYTGGVALNQPGAFPSDANTSVLLNGATGYVQAAISTALNTADGPLTLEAWVKRSTPGRVDTIVHKGTGAYQLRFNADNRLALLKANIAQVAQSTVTVADTSWHYVVATKNAAVTHLFIDGADVTGTVTNQTLTDATSSNLR